MWIFQVLLVSSSNEQNSWIVPGGGLEPEEEPEETAVREVLEEAGVTGRLGICLGVFEVVNLPVTKSYVFHIHKKNFIAE